jgi:hypothetical protein
MNTNKTEDEIYALYDQCVEYENKDISKFPGMTYEQGVKATIAWLFDGCENPLDD